MSQPSDVAGSCGLHHPHQQQQQQQPGPPAPPSSGVVRTEQHGNQILHVRGDSDSDLEALFSVLHSIDGRPPASSFKNRKLPASFFRPPDPRMNPAAACAAHGRSVSSPAQLHHPMTAGATPGVQSAATGGGGGGVGVGHVKQLSAGGAEAFMDEFGACWDASKNCPRYFLNNHAGGLWPAQDMAMLAAGHGYQLRCHGHGAGTGGAPGGGPVGHHQHIQGDFCHAAVEPTGPLPHGWDQGVTPDGEIYFINHIDKTTSWLDPRIPRHRNCAMRLSHQQQPQQQSSQSHHLSPKQQQQQQQCQMMSHQQMMSGSHPQLGGAGGGGGGSGGSGVRPNEHFICLELQKLYKEKERLQQEQDAITCREMMLNELARQTTTATSPPCADHTGAATQMKCAAVPPPQQQQQPPPEGALAMMHAMQSLYGGTAVDPFVGQCAGGAVVESHARQNSTDSGLGGMGTAYSLPRSPDDYLSNVDEMDLQEDGIPPLQKPINSCYVLGGDPGRHGLHVGDEAMDAGGTLVDSDHLVSSLAGDLTSDLLSDMDVQKIDNLLWL